MRVYAGLLASLCVLLAYCGGASATEGPPVLPAEAYLLMDAASGQVLVNYRGDERLPMASTTKIMTALLTLERGNLSDLVTVGTKPYETGGSTIYLEIGEKQTLADLLYALMLESANDAGVAIAEHLAGTEEQFAIWMSDRAREMGAVNTQFKNSHGLHADGHYSTARDLAVIARHAMRNPAFREVIAVQEREIPGAVLGIKRKLYNRNRLLGYYEGTTGVKNGYTEEAGLTNVAAAKRGDTEFIAVVLGAQDRLWTSSMALLDYGFAHFRSHIAARKGDVVGPAEVAGAKPVAAVVTADVAISLPLNQPAPERLTIWEPDLKAPLDKGTRLGAVQYRQGDQIIASADVVAPLPVLPEPGKRSEPGPQPATEPRTLAQWYWVVLIGVTLLVTQLTFRRLRNRRAGSVGRQAHGRDRLYQIRNRRRL